jgi:hypothetical protein
VISGKACRENNKSNEHRVFRKLLVMTDKKVKKSEGIKEGTRGQRYQKATRGKRGKRGKKGK